MADKKRAQKVSHVAEKRIEEPSSQFQRFISGRLGDKRLIDRILDGRKVKPCGRECREFGCLIASSFNHDSFENFNELMNDEEFILEIAKITPNPTECENYFYKYVSKFLKGKSSFRLEFLKAIYLNSSVYKLDDINKIVSEYGFEKENETILNDMGFKQMFYERILSLNCQDMIEFHCSGSVKELHEHKIKANNAKVLVENMKKGLMQIYDSFTKNKTEGVEPQTYYEYVTRMYLAK